jgi:hypothetical protein
MLKNILTKPSTHSLDTFTNFVIVDEQNAINLYILAHIFKEESLKQKCIENIKNLISIENLLFSIHSLSDIKLKKSKSFALVLLHLIGKKLAKQLLFKRRMKVYTKN